MSNQSLYAMYAIGQVESNHNWTAVNKMKALEDEINQLKGQTNA